MASDGIAGSPGAGLDHIPALAPPTGVIPDFLHPYNRGKTQTAAATTIIGIMIVLVTNRQYTKLFIVRQTGWDDCKFGRMHSG